MEKMQNEELHQNMHRVKRRNTSTNKMLIKESEERCDMENCTLGRKGSLRLSLKLMENKPSGNWRRKMKSQRKSDFCRSTVLGLET